MTALKSAVQGNHGEVAAVLVERGANPNDVYKVRICYTIFNELLESRE